MIEAVLDVNVIVSGFSGGRGAPSELIERWLAGEFRVIASEHILRGAARAWNNPWFRDLYPRHKAERARELLRTRAVIVTPASGVPDITPDREDDLVLVTGDRRFRAIGQYEAIAIRSPRDFVSILDQERLPLS